MGRPHNYFAWRLRSAQRFFIAAEMRLRAAADITFRLRGSTSAAPVVAAAGVPPSFARILAA